MYILKLIDKIFEGYPNLLIYISIYKKYIHIHLFTD